MDLYNGGDLRHFLNKNHGMPLQEENAIIILKDILEGCKVLKE